MTTDDRTHPSHRTVRTSSIVEGVSLLALLLVAMPLKYLAGYPLAVTIVGSVHGLLFLVLVVVVGQAAFGRVLGPRLSLAVLVLSVVPFGFVLADRMLRASGDAPQA